MKVTAVELPEIPDTDSKDTAKAVDNIYCERIPSELMYCITYHGHSHEFVVLSNYTSPDTKTNYSYIMCITERDAPRARAHGDIIIITAITTMSSCTLVQNYSL